jgi:hypothetical protein
MSKSVLTVGAFGLLLSFASAEEAPVLKDEALTKRAATRYVPSGITRTLWFLYAAKPDCSLMGSTEVRTTKEPAHGAVEIVPTEDFPTFARDNVRFKCNDKKIRGLNVDYKSAEEYVGPDEFDLLVLWPGGNAWDMHFNIIVR